MKTQLFSVIIGLCVSTAVCAETSMKLSVSVEPSAWGSGQFAALLRDAIDRTHPERELQWNEVTDGWFVVPAEPLSQPDKKGKQKHEEVRALIVTVVVHPYELVTRKTFDAPGLFHSYGVFGEAHAALRVVERTSGRVLLEEDIVQSKKGPRVLQLSIDGDRYDPDLQMTALVKHRFFETLEQETANAVAARLASLSE